ncbi:MAG: hypothetical protein M1816_007667 [Peltula sp. TS41687]|nr:MAG: hypothetical protein M1816_007667 [Peltula sp. TS41687]
MKVFVKTLVLALNHALITKAQGYGAYDYGVENYDNKPTQSVSYHQNACALTDCAKLPYLQQCTPEWYDALTACTEPPCNVRYITDPAIDCSDDYSVTEEAYMPTLTESALDTDVTAYGGYEDQGDFDTTITEDITVTATTGSVPTGFPEIPKCAETCFNQTVSTDGCEYTDAACHCTKTDAFEKSFGTCVVNVCSPSDQQKYIWVLTDQCNALGVALTATTPAIASPTLVKRQDPADGNYPDIPECSKYCFNQTVFTDGCAFTDAACHCTKVEAFTSGFACIAEHCAPPCQLRYQQILVDQCKALGVPVTAPLIVPRPSSQCAVTEYPAIPECAAACFNQTLVTDGCCPTDGACHCGKTEAFQESFNNCVVDACPSPYDQNAYLQALDKSCDDLCVPVPSGSRLTLSPASTPAGYYVKRHGYDYMSFTSTATPSSVWTVYNMTTEPIATATETATTIIETPSTTANESFSFVQNTETPLASNSAGTFGGSVMVSFITPTEEAYDRNHGPIPHLSAATHTVLVDGLVHTPLKLSINQLQHDFAQHEVVCALQCAGNRRHTMRTQLKEVEGVDWGDGAVMNCRWRGPRLRDVLARAGVAVCEQGTGQWNEAHVAFACAATPCQDDGWYGASIPLRRAVAREGEVLLALEMNGHPLPPAHGYPVRIVAPGIAGARSVKWLDRITVQLGESANYYQQHDYKILPAEATDWASAEEYWATTPAVQDMPVNSVIGVPKSGALVKLEGGTTEVRGYALPKGDQGPVRRVEVSVDEGETWADAEIVEGKELGESQGKWCWCLWRARVRLQRGVGRRVLSKATDSGGNMQAGNPRWNLRGVCYDGYGEARDLVVE